MRAAARFWALMVANAFRLIVIGASTLLAVFILVLIQVGQYGGSPQGELVWFLMSIVATIAAAAVGSGQLRADPRRGRTVALICVAVMAGLRSSIWPPAGVLSEAVPPARSRCSQVRSG